MLNREPMGMKPRPYFVFGERRIVSVLNREPMGMKLPLTVLLLASNFKFQCSTASRWG